MNGESVMHSVVRQWAEWELAFIIKAYLLRQRSALRRISFWRIRTKIRFPLILGM